MKAAFSTALLFMLLISCIFWGIWTEKISVLGQPEFFTKLTSSTPFDFLQQWRKTKKDSGEWTRSEGRLLFRAQGITPLWACVYSRDEHEARNPVIIASSDGGLMLGCTHFIRSTYDYWTGIIKLSYDSSIEWQRSFKTYYDINMVKCIEQTDDGGFIVGLRSSIGDHGFLILKFSPGGYMDWAHCYAGFLGEYPHSIMQTSEGGYIVSGVTTSFINPEYIDPYWGFEVDLMIIKLSRKGEIEWQRAFGGPKFETEWLGGRRNSTIIESCHGGYLIVVDTPSFSENEQSDLWVLKLSDLGDIEWQRVYGGEQSEWLINLGPHVTETIDGKYVIACQTYSYGVVDQDNDLRYSDVWVIKLKPNGDVEWQKTYGEKGAETVHAIIAVDNGGCIVAGASNSWSSSNISDFWVFKLSPAGKIIWERLYGGELWDEATSVCITEDNGLAIAGITSSFENEYEDLLVLKLTSDGKLGDMCSDLVRDSNAVVMDTYAVPFDTYEIARVAEAGKSTPRIIKEEIDLEKRTICWNFNQPPVNVHFERIENKSFFVFEVWHTITWNPNPYNSDNGYAIAEYKIYRREREDSDNEYSAFQQIGTIQGNMYMFVDKYIQPDKQYQYRVTSVDSDGNESPKSDLIGNFN